MPKKTGSPKTTEAAVENNPPQVKEQDAETTTPVPTNEELAQSDTPPAEPLPADAESEPRMSRAMELSNQHKTLVKDRKQKRIGAIDAWFEGRKNRTHTSPQDVALAEAYRAEKALLSFELEHGIV